MSFKDKAMRPFIIVIFGVLLTACAIIAPGLSYLLSGVTIDTAGGTTTSNESALVSDISSQDGMLSSATIKPLKITAPAQSEITVTTAKTVFTGNCDPDEILLINGKKNHSFRRWQFFTRVQFNLWKKLLYSGICRHAKGLYR